MMVNLSDRLEMSAMLIHPSECVADVGCDHAHTCIWLIQNYVAKRCIGMDVRKGPLLKAKENLELYECADRVELRLGYGLDELKAGEADNIVIAGMGGEMIRDILEKDKSRNKAAEDAALVLQPQSHQEIVRSWLEENDYAIINENMCCEDDKFYVTIKAKKRKNSEGVIKYRLSPAEIYYGPVLLRKKHPVLKEFLEIEYRKKKHMLEQIGKSDKEEAKDKKQQVEAVFEIICSAQEWFENPDW